MRYELRFNTDADQYEIWDVHVAHDGRVVEHLMLQASEQEWNHIIRMIVGDEVINYTHCTYTRVTPNA